MSTRIYDQRQNFAGAGLTLRCAQKNVIYGKRKSSNRQLAVSSGQSLCII